MNKVVIATGLLLLALALVAGPAGAQTGGSGELFTGGTWRATVDYSFGQYITFQLEADAPTTITQVNLFFQVQGQGDVVAVPLPVEPGTQVSVEHAFSPNGQSVPPFAIITFWWEIRDETGMSQQSERLSFYYADNRYDWQKLPDQPKGTPSVIVHWVRGDVVFGQTALNVATQALDEIGQDLGVSPPADVHIYIYPGEDDLRSALSLGGYDWAGGQARPELGAVLVGVTDGPSARGELERLIPHELTHLLVYEVVGRRAGLVPPWLNEGLASLNERRPNPDREALVKEAQAEDRLIPLEALCAPFPLNAESARLAYAQSASLVDYLRRERGYQVIRDLLAAYRDKVDCEGGVKRVLGQTLTELELAWRADLLNEGRAIVALKDSGVWLALWGLTLLLVLPLLGVVRRGRRLSGGEG